MNIEVGQEFLIYENKEISRVQLVKYAGASGDFNPIHTVEKAGEEAGTGVIVHGMLIMGMMAEGITKWIPRKSIKKFNVRFRKMTKPGEAIQIVGKIIEKTQDNLIIGEVQAKNLDGEIKVAGVFEAQLPN